MLDKYIHFILVYIYLGLHAKCPIFLPDISQICDFLADFHDTPHSPISQKSVQCDPRWYMGTDGQTDKRMGITKLFSRLCERT